MSRFDELKIFSGTGHPALTEAICSYIGVQAAGIQIQKFPNDNIFVKLLESIREQDVFIVQSLHTPLSDRIMELLLIIDACKRDSAGRITAVLPYYAYSRTDKRDQPRVPISARLLADMLEVAGAHRVLTLDLHAGQIQGFFRIPVDEMSAMHLLIQRVRELRLENATVVATSLGFAKRARNFAEALDMPLALVERRHDHSDGSITHLNLLGEVAGRDCIIVDDEIATGRTMLRVAHLLKERGAARLIGAAVHPVLCDGALERFKQGPLEMLITTDSIPHPQDAWPGLRVASVAPLLGETILRIHKGISVGAMFQEGHAQLGRW
ncbi:ribose-phosphate diphosphokinase [Kallotenue papyrolyticum]|uniref:ribose-phosphate diphosphokinase n=1 Tax=Kallotenue papyrolyticum TaxID=1325125 RepID=UPI000478547E|nr:ribose-phosphate pyrophosphokinase [Kallotenue papyrolyticum]